MANFDETLSMGDWFRYQHFLWRRFRAGAKTRLRLIALRGLPAAWRSSCQLVLAPQEMRTADPTMARELCNGVFSFAGQWVECPESSPFQVKAPSETWAMALYGFGWLRHLRASNNEDDRACARGLIQHWMDHGRKQPASQRAETISRRILSMVSHASFVLEEADISFYRAFHRALMDDVRLLEAKRSAVPDGADFLRVLMALLAAHLCMSNGRKKAAYWLERLLVKLDFQILPDGGHISRNPDVLVEVLLDLLPIRQLLRASELSAPGVLDKAISRAMPMIRFMRHEDGQFFHFHGAGHTRRDLVAAVLAHDEALAPVPQQAPDFGYSRLSAGDTLIMVDTGICPPLGFSVGAHASCLAFEMSVGGKRLIQNCGVPHYGHDEWRMKARMTKAHSTLILNMTSSCSFAPDNRHGRPVLSGPTQVSTEREETSEGIMLEAVHDGYARRFGLLHRRRLKLSADGTRLDGVDAVAVAHGKTLARRDDLISVRFHLNRLVQIEEVRNGIVLSLEGQTWLFSADHAAIVIEDSLAFSATHGVRNTRQLVLKARAGQAEQIAWRFHKQIPMEKAS